MDPTEAELRAAWEDRRREGWPHTFEESMEREILRRIITMHAKHGMGTGDRRIQRQSEHEAMSPKGLPELPAYDPAQDIKRRASGDVDDSGFD